MSIQALTWVIYGASADIKYAAFRTLLVLADHADPQGKGAYPSRSTISRLTGYSVRTVSYALKSLEASGLISRGDQRIVSNLGGYKPTVWNLNMGRGAKTAPLENAEPAVQHDCTPPVQTDCTPEVQTAVQKTRTGVQTGVQHDCTRTISKEEPYIEPRESNAREKNNTNPNRLETIRRTPGARRQARHRLRRRGREVPRQGPRFRNQIGRLGCEVPQLARQGQGTWFRHSEERRPPTVHVGQCRGQTGPRPDRRGGHGLVHGARVQGRGPAQPGRGRGDVAPPARGCAG